MGSRAGGRNMRSGVLAALLLVFLACGASGLTDLEVRNVVLDPLTVEQGGTARISATVASIGAIEGDSFVVRIGWRRIDFQEECCYEDQLVGRSPAISGVALQQEIDTTSLLPGEYVITVTIDPDNRIAEEDETNNQSAVTLTVTALRPELHPIELFFDPAAPADWGEVVSVTTRLENSGSGASGGFRVEHRLLPALIHSADGVWYQVSAVVTAGETPTGEWLFEEVSEMAATTSTWLDTIAAGLADEGWIPFWTADIAGLGQDHQADLTGVLPTGYGLRVLLSSGTMGKLPGSAMPPLSTEQLNLLDGGTAIYAISLAVDSEENVAEEDEANNVIVGFLSVIPSNLTFPELRFVGLAFEGPLPMEWGDRQDVKAIIQNTGGSPVEEDQVMISFAYRRVGAGGSGWTPLQPATATVRDRIGVEEGTNTAEVEVSVDVDDLGLEPGSYELRAVVDPGEQVVEQNEANNELVIGFSVEGAELHPTGLVVGSQTIRQGDTLTVSVPVRNTGEQTLTNFVTGFFLDDIRFDTHYYYDVSAAARDEGLEEDDIAWAHGSMETEDLDPGTYQLRIVVDPDNAVPELDERNNTISQTIEILPQEARLAELVPVSMDLTPDSPLIPGQNVLVEVEVWNRGTLDASAFQVRLEVSSSGSREWSSIPDEDSTTLVQSLARGARLTLHLGLSGELVPIDDAYAIRVVVDPADQVREKDEQNNILSVGALVGLPSSTGEITITPYANLVFKSLIVSPTQDVDARELVTVGEAIVWNAGLEAAGSFLVSFCWQGQSGTCVPTNRSVSIDGLAAESELDISGRIGVIEAPAMPGSYQLVGLADATGSINERGRESDNQTAAFVQVTGMVKPDLAVEEIWFEPASSVEVGSSAQAFARIRNLSNDVGASSFVVRFEQENGGSARDYSVSRLGPQSTIELSFGLSTAAVGTYGITVTADIENDVIESDDDAASGNNTRTASFSVTTQGLVDVEALFDLGSSLRWLAVDSTNDIVYAATIAGRVVAVSHADPATFLFDVTLSAATPTAMAFVDDLGLYVGTSSGTLYLLSESTGNVIRQTTLGSGIGIGGMSASDSGVLYATAGTSVFAVDLAGNTLEATLTDAIIDLSVDSTSGNIYAITVDSLFALGSSLALRCVVAELDGMASALATGPSAVYVGTTEGSLLAYELCQGNGASLIWRFPANGNLGSAVGGVAVDPRDFDPIYVGTASGLVVAVDALGQEIWRYAMGSGLGSAPTWDGRTGRVFAVDQEGIPYILTSSGQEVFPINGSASIGVTVSSPLIIDDFIAGSGSSAQLVRVYYYGGDDGTLYVIRTER